MYPDKFIPDENVIAWGQVRLHVGGSVLHICTPTNLIGDGLNEPRQEFLSALIRCLLFLLIQSNCVFSTIGPSYVIVVKRFVKARSLGDMPTLTSQDGAAGLEEPAARSMLIMTFM